MNVNLTQELEQVVRRKVKTGLYNNASEVVREALRLLLQRDALELVRTEAAKGFAQLRSGNSAPLNMQRTKRMAKANTKKGRVVNPLVAG